MFMSVFAYVVLQKYKADRINILPVVAKALTSVGVPKKI